MAMNVGKQIAALKRMTVTELRVKHVEVFGEATRSGHKDYLVKRIAWRIQANAEGGLSERARRRAEELANDADLRIRAPKAPQVPEAGQTATAVVAMTRPNAPPPGTVLTRPYKGRESPRRLLRGSVSDFF